MDVHVGLLLCFLGLMHVRPVSSVVRKYYIAAQDIEWEYADSTINLVNTDQQSYADTYLKKTDGRIGRKYLKTTYFQYTDDTFSTQIPKPSYLGILGPTIRAEIGDAIDITYLNNATGTYSMHPHGVFYLKQNEGALYLDGTSGRFKFDEMVTQGQTIRIMWNVTDRDGPGQADPNCLPWVYHSHVNTVKDTSAGLVGGLVTCKKGILDGNNERTDVAVDIPILAKIYDENLSWLLDYNMKTYCTNVTACKQLAEGEDGDFIESNYKHSLNGRMFGHLKGLEACVGEKVAFYVIGMGNEFDIHSVYFQGQNLNYQHTRGDTISVFTATFVAAEYTPTLAGSWVVSDMVDGMARTGMSAFYTTKDCGANTRTNRQTDDVKEYFLSAEEVEWNYGPGGVDQYTNKSLTDERSFSHIFFEKANNRIGGTYKKARFFQYTDRTFTSKVGRSSDDEHMGILGPVIEAEVGQTVKVTLKNDVSFPVSFLPHGLSFNSSEEMGKVFGAKKPPSSIVQPGNQHTYTFQVPENLLDEEDVECHNYIYVSGVDPTRDHNTGLLGPILVCRKGHSQTKNNSKRLFVLTSTFDENESHLLDDNIGQYTSGVDKSDESFKRSNVVYTINGFAFGTIPGLTMCVGDDVTWYTMVMGSNQDVHSLTFDGNTFTKWGKNRNVQKLVAGGSAVLAMQPDNSGSWLVQSVTVEAKLGGAYGLYDVCGASTKAGAFAKNREYYIAAQEVEWEYAPKRRSIVTGNDLDDPSEEGNIFVRDNRDFIGDVYRKAVFRQYEDPQFISQKIRSFTEKHLDILGPVIRAEVGDKITIHFKNKASRPYSMHPHGLKYSHEDSGKTYGEIKGDVGPGETKIYTWHVPPRSGPGPNDPDCVPWLYYSGIMQVRDAVSGLVGPIVICRSGTLGDDGLRKDKHQELFLLMSVLNENKSWYLRKNVELYAPNRIGTKYAEDPDFEESNKMHSINGRLFGNNQGLVVELNRTVNWYFMVMGSVNDLHTFHTHGHTFIHSSNGHRDDVLSLFPGMAEAVEMRPDNPGTWFLHCHVLDHIAAGMETTYTVLKEGISIPTDGSGADPVIG